ncbi:hypothetical protein LG201_06715 [Methylobacillus gramineus]|uniref:hypothetical protein n=1 Tax=Methylobacillus gramineus TaxID=755169 RepID=UPI001CFF766D|nr:hypothetical protein [Methylobacillus gramineus]MCB5184893.1 hypothetical protein [Methylobacillus gramineus]
MQLFQFLRSPTFALYAVSAWMISFLIITDSQAHNNISYLILLVPTLISLQYSEVKQFFSNRLAQGLVLVILSLVLAASTGDGDPLRQVKFGLIVILFFIAVARLPAISDRIAYRAAWSYLGLIIPYVIFNMAWQYHQGIWLPGARLGELEAKLENVIYVTNTMGGMLAIITLLGIRAKKYRSVLLAHGLVLFLSLTILQTRSIIGIWVATLLLTYFAVQRHSPGKHKHTLWIISASLVASMGIAYLLAFTSIGENLLARNFYRPEIWWGYISETLRCGFWLGCGPDHDFQYISRDGNTMIHPHSIYVTQFYKAGLIGLLPLLALTFWAGVRGYQAKSWAAWYFIVGVLGLCFDGSSLVHSPSQRWLVFHLPLALLIAQQLHHSRLSKSAEA